MTYLQPNFCRFNSQASEISNLVSTKLFKHCWSFHWGCQLVGTWNKRQGMKGRCELLHIIALHHPSLAIKCPKTYRRRKEKIMRRTKKHVKCELDPIMNWGSLHGRGESQLVLNPTTWIAFSLAELLNHQSIQLVAHQPYRWVQKGDEILNWDEIRAILGWAWVWGGETLLIMMLLLMIWTNKRSKWGFAR